MGSWGSGWQRLPAESWSVGPVAPGQGPFSSVAQKTLWRVSLSITHIHRWKVEIGAPVFQFLRDGFKTKVAFVYYFMCSYYFCFFFLQFPVTMAWWQWFPWRLALDLLHFTSIRHLTFHNLTALCCRDNWQGSILSRPTLEGGHLMMSGDVLVFTTRGERMLLPSNREGPGTMQISYRVCSVRYCLAPHVRGAKVEEPSYLRSLDCSCDCHAQGNIRVVLASVKEIPKAWDCRCLGCLV